MGFREKVENGSFVITGEIGPPKGVDITTVLEGARFLSRHVDAVNVTDLQSSVMRAGSMALSILLHNEGIEPIFQMTCRDRNRLALQSDLLSAYVLGIRSVLVLTGDHPALGDHPDAKPVYDFDSVLLLEAVRSLNSGADMSGNDLKGRTNLLAGAVVNPGADPLEPEIIKMEKKIEAGARFFQTQAVYDVEKFQEFRKAIRHIKEPVYAGIVPLKSARMAQYMNKNVPGVQVPEDMIRAMDEASDRQAKSVEIASSIISRLRPFVQGVHIMPIGWNHIVPEIIREAGLSEV